MLNLEGNEMKLRIYRLYKSSSSFKASNSYAQPDNNVTSSIWTDLHLEWKHILNVLLNPCVDFWSSFPLKILPVAHPNTTHHHSCHGWSFKRTCQSLLKPPSENLGPGWPLLLSLARTENYSRCRCVDTGILSLKCIGVGEESTPIEGHLRRSRKLGLWLCNLCLLWI